MTICYFGLYRPDYACNRLIIKALKNNGVKIIEVQDRTPGWRKYWRLFKQHQKIKNNYDLMIVGFPGQAAMLLAKVICRRPIVFNLYVSLYDANVFERNNCRPFSFLAAYSYFLDWLGCALADKVLLDTREHIKYLARLLHVSEKKFIVIYHGAEIQPFVNTKLNQEGTFIVVFYGYVTPLHGLEYILQAAKILARKKIQFWLIVGGQSRAKIMALANDLDLPHVLFFDQLPFEKLILKLRGADLGLGIFGATGKVARVIPNKVYELMALGVPVLTADSPAIRELFEDRKELYLCPPADQESLAAAILELKNDYALRQELAQKAYQKMSGDLSPAATGRQLLSALETLNRDTKMN